MKQFILSRKPDKDGIVKLEGSDFRYLVRIRRLAAGDSFLALLPDGEETQVEVLAINGSILTGKCTFPKNLTQRTAGSKGTEKKSVEELPKIILFQAMPKGDKMDLIVRQAAEGGITEIVPFISEHSVVKTLSPGKQKFARWEKIIKEARQQSGSRTATIIHQPLSMSDLINYWSTLGQSGALGLLFHHEGLEQESLHSYLNSNPKAVALAVGPEGGFSGREISLFLKSGFKPFKIGDTVLRTETAALYCAAAIRILLLEKNSWELKQTKNRSA
ncbi:MAG: 16S rRNA (uracil(1498)-N(3))-methyltransferase [Treponema sp.]|nr:16S rRNA (uracil(1498)-N(3))-methyltransferase [Treponema sp.]